MMRNMITIKDEGQGLGKNVTAILKSLVVGVLVFLFLSIIYATILAYTNVNDNQIYNITQLITLFSIASASIYGSILLKKKGWLLGIIIGGIFAIATVIITYFTGIDMATSKEIIMKTLFYTLGGIIGGMIGVNVVGK